jgi:adenine-specific DNA-methyltransferase
VTISVIHPNVIEGKKPTLSPFAPVLPDDIDKQHKLGQFFTPNPVAEFMASLFEIHRSEVRLLDAGAGAGALSAALVGRLCRESRRPRRISITAYEIDTAQMEPLRARLDDCRRECERAGISFSTTVLNEDFIAAAVPMVRGDLFASESPRFNTAIVNPPYRKIRSDSSTRLLLRSAGIEASNLYAGFVALITRLLDKGGEVVAITPRSFCNGPYFKPFREDLLEAMSLRRLHVFESRSAAFSSDAVLQENIIFHAVNSAPKPEQVIISSSSGAAGSPVAERAVEYREVVSPDDAEQFIHLIEGDRQDTARVVMGRLSGSLSKLGLSVSTGRVVDFRAKEFLRQHPKGDTAPLIYPCHFSGGFVHWPKEKARKPNAIVSNEQTRELLVPAGVYVLVKRFTAKEERKRIVACIYDSHQIHAPLVGFENHLNYFQVNGHGLPMSLAKGLAAFLNSTVVDAYFHQLNGHTQVNATNLRSLRSKYSKSGRFPSRGRRFRTSSFRYARAFQCSRAQNRIAFSGFGRRALRPQSARRNSRRNLGVASSAWI